MCQLREIKAKNYSHLIEQIAQKKIFSLETYTQIDTLISEILQKFDKQYKKEKKPPKIEALLFLSNTVEKIQYLCWCHAFKFHQLQYPMDKTFLCTPTNLFLECHKFNDFKFDQTILPLDTLHNMLQWTLFVVQIARSLFPSYEHDRFQLMFFGNDNFRKIFIDFYFS